MSTLPYMAPVCSLWSRTQKELGEDATAAAADLLARLYDRDPHPGAARRRPGPRRAEILIALGELDAAAIEIRQSLALSAHLGNRHQRGCAHADLGKLHAARGDFERAAEETLDLVEAQVTTERTPRRAQAIAEDLEALELEPEAATALAAWTQAVVAGEPLTGPGQRARAALANASAPARTPTSM